MQVSVLGRRPGKTAGKSFCPSWTNIVKTSTIADAECNCSEVFQDGQQEDQTSFSPCVQAWHLYIKTIRFWLAGLFFHPHAFYYMAVVFLYVAICRWLKRRQSPDPSRVKQAYPRYLLAHPVGIARFCGVAKVEKGLRSSSAGATGLPERWEGC